MRLAASLLLVSAAVLPTAAFAHPHVAGDPFADVGDTIVAGSAKIAPIRGPSHQRWRATEFSAGREQSSIVDQVVRRADTPAGRQWCVVIEKRSPGEHADFDSIFVTAGPPIPVYWKVRSRAYGTFTFDGREVNGTYQSESLTFDDATFPLTHASYPEPLEELVLSRLDYRAGMAVAIAFFDPRTQAGEYHLAVEVAGETRLDHAGHERRCWFVAVADDRFPAGSRTIWIDQRTRALLREEFRNASGDVTERLEAE